EQAVDVPGRVADLRQPALQPVDIRAAVIEPHDTGPDLVLLVRIAVPAATRTAEIRGDTTLGASNLAAEIVHIERRIDFPTRRRTGFLVSNNTTHRQIELITQCFTQFR